MFKRGIFFTILFVTFLTAVFLLSPDQTVGGKDTIAYFYLPVTINLKPLTPFLVKDINIRTPSSFIYCPHALSMHMICSAHDEAHGYELWRHNGEEGGASFLQDIDPDMESYAMRFRAVTAQLEDKILFAAADELWQTKGTPASTLQLKGSFWSFDSEEPFTVGGELMYFLANDGEHGLELWRSNGSPSGTKLLEDIWPGSHNMGIYSLTPVGEQLYFIVEGDDYYTLWVSDGTSAGTNQVPVTSQWPVTHIAALDDFLVMNVHDMQFEPSSLWRTDGTEVGTEKISIMERIEVWIHENSPASNQRSFSPSAMRTMRAGGSEARMVQKQEPSCSVKQMWQAGARVN